MNSSDTTSSETFLRFISAADSSQEMTDAQKYLNSILVANTKSIIKLNCSPDTDLSVLFSNLFSDVYDLNISVAIRWLFFVRDSIKTIHAKNFFKFNFKWLVLNKKPEFIKELIVAEIPKHGNWDDLFCLLELKNFTDFIIELFDYQLAEDCRNNYEENYKDISSLALYLPNIDSKSADLAKFIAKKLNLFPTIYQKLITKLRKNIQIPANYRDNSSRCNISPLMNIDNMSIISELKSDKYSDIVKLTTKHKLF